MDGMNFGGRAWRPDETQATHADAGWHAALSIAVFAVILLVTLTGIVVMDRLGLPLSTSEISADP